MNDHPLGRSINPVRRLISTTRIGLAFLLSAATAQAQISVQDGNPLTITQASGTAINQPFTVTANAKVLVVILAERGARLSEPATLSWNGQTLTRDVQTAHNNGVQCSVAIYHLFIPVAGTANITGTMNGATSDTWLTAYTLNGVDTTLPPM